MFSTRKLTAGIAGGLAGGLVFGLMMARMGMLPMIGQMVGSPTVSAGWLAHLGISAAIGASFGVLAGWVALGRISSAIFGTIYGAIWWILGPLTLMPLFMGMGLGVNWNAAAAAGMLPSLYGHLIFGILLGLVYDLAVRRIGTSRPTAAGQATREAEAVA